jgi:hypothetical protein
MLTGVIGEFAGEEIHRMVQNPRRQVAVTTVSKRIAAREISVVGRIAVCELFQELD